MINRFNLLTFQCNNVFYVNVSVNVYDVYCMFRICCRIRRNTRLVPIYRHLYIRDPHLITVTLKLNSIYFCVDDFHTNIIPLCYVSNNKFVT